MKLNKGKIGKTYIVLELNGNVDTNMNFRNLGLEVGEKVTILSKIASSLVIGVKDSRLGLDDRLGKLIEVEKI